jgi:hypothetical protein
MYATVTNSKPGLGETIGSLHEYVRTFTLNELEKIRHALATTKEDKSNPFNANYPKGATLYAWEQIVISELARREYSPAWNGYF